VIIAGNNDRTARQFQIRPALCLPVARQGDVFEFEIECFGDIVSV
jgi:hypothetical protein